MSVTTVKKKNNMLGGLGTIAQAGGMATGQTWLTALGTGMKGLQKQMNGDDNNDDDGTGALRQIFDGLNGAWQSLSGGNIAKVNTDDVTDEQLMKNWALPYGFGSSYNGWGV